MFKITRQCKLSYFGEITGLVEENGGDEIGVYCPSLHTLVWLWMHIRLKAPSHTIEGSTMKHIINVSLAVELVLRDLVLWCSLGHLASFNLSSKAETGHRETCRLYETLL